MTVQNFSRVVATKCSNHYTIFPLQMTVVNLKLNDERRKKRNSSYVHLLWFGGRQKWRIIRRKKKSTSFYPLHHQLSDNLFGLQTIGENQISVVSLSFWTKTWTIIIHPRPKTATPVFSPSRKKSNQNTRRKFVSDCDQYPLIFVFCLSLFSCLSKQPPASFFL